MRYSKPISALILCIAILASLIIPVDAKTNADTNDDGVYSIDDVIISLKYASGILECDDEDFHYADVVHDGYLTTEDSKEILRIAAGIRKAPTHEYTEWEIIEESTCTTEGYMVCYCDICEEPFYATIPMSDHAFVDGVCEDCGFSKNNHVITYNKKSIAFGSTTTQLKEIYGTPTEILSDKTTTGQSIKIYVYASNYNNLGIFTFKKNKLIQFFSNNKASSVSYGTQLYSLKKADIEEEFILINKILVEQFVDYQTDDDVDYVYSYLASTDTTYNFQTMTDSDANERLVCYLVNGCRAIHEVDPVEYCPEVAKVAYAHSLDMANRNYFDHINPEGDGPYERMLKAGITDMYACGENIAAGYQNAYNVNNGWYQSPGHRSNMLSDFFTHLGVGIVYDTSNSESYGDYATENFYTPS